MSAINLLDRARQAQLSGNYDAAEADYREVLKSTDPSSSDDADTIVSKASWNLALILRDQHGAFAEAADVLAPTRRTRTGTLRRDPELHTLYAQLRFKEFESRAARSDLGSTRPLFAGADNALSYTPAPLAALREGVRAYQTALRQSTDEFAGFANEAQTGVDYGVNAYKAFAGSVQEAAVGPMMAAFRDRALKNGKIAADSPLARAQYATEGPMVDAVTAKTVALRDAAKAAMMDNGDYTARWQQWLLMQIGAANALTTPEQ